MVVLIAYIVVSEILKLLTKFIRLIPFLALLIVHGRAKGIVWL